MASSTATLRDALLSLARFYNAEARPEIAEAATARLVDLIEDPEEKARMLVGLGGSCEGRGDFKKAARYYARGIPLEPEDLLVSYLLNNNLGFCLIQAGCYQRGAVYCEAAIRICPARHNAHKNLGLALEGQGQYVEAARCYMKATELGPRDRRALRHLRELVQEHPEVAWADPEIFATQGPLSDYL